MSKLLLDTNVLLDFADATRPEQEFAVRLLASIFRGENEAAIAASSLKDAYYILCKFQGEQAARDWVRVFVRAIPVEQLDVEICATALDSDEPDYEDGCIRAIAERAQVDFIITRDKRAFARSWVKSYSAREFLELFPPVDERGWHV